MPIQPLAATRLANSLACELSSLRRGLFGSKVPLAISSARNARASRRRIWQDSGRRIGSKVRADDICCRPFLARGNQRPQIIGAARTDAVAEFHRPVAFIAEIVAPAERAQAEAM